MGRRLLLAVLLLIATATVATTASADPAPGLPVQFLDSVSCVSTTACLAVGDRTVVIGTTDGATWTRRTSPPGVSSLTSVECVTAARCFVTGDDSRDIGAIWLTTDGGTTWSVRPTTVPGGFFFALSCPSRTMCVATGNEGMLAVTTDGGRSWTSHDLNKVSLILDVDCVTTQVCYAVGYSGGNGVTGVTLRSVDGGQHWLVRTFPDQLASLEAVDCTSTQRCVAVGHFHDSRGGDHAGIYRTTDAGRTWDTLALPDGHNYVNGVSCPSELVCFTGSYGAGPAVLATFDGGATWQEQGPVGDDLHDVSCLNTTTCFAVGEVERRGNGAVFATTNGGRFWHRQPISPSAP